LRGGPPAAIDFLRCLTPERTWEIDGTRVQLNEEERHGGGAHRGRCNRGRTEERRGRADDHRSGRTSTKDVGYCALTFATASDLKKLRDAIDAA
jgi:hypothetical protein